jgi:prepilin-type N-terminal cleavage/methylation domain-containing protein
MNTMNTRMQTKPNTTGRSGFSLVEMLIAMTITSTLLTAMLVALDFNFKRYQATSESASMHVVGRLVTHRILAQVRTGTTFGPSPADVHDPAQNPVIADNIEFITEADRAAGLNRVTRFEYRPDPGDATLPGTLWYVLINADVDPAVLVQERPLLSGVRSAFFTLEFNEENWLLDQATIDITLDPDVELAQNSSVAAMPESVRLIASATPRQLR